MKTPTQQAIEDAIAGGWLLRGSKVTVFKRGGDLRWQHDGYTEAVNVSEVLLDPRFWQAVGKTRGWEDDETDEYLYTTNIGWRFYMHRFIDHRADGKTIDEALAVISQGV